MPAASPPASAPIASPQAATAVAAPSASLPAAPTDTASPTITAAAPPSPAPMAATYWSRLSGLLRSAVTLSASLVPPPSLTADKAAKGLSGVVGLDLQGLPSAALQRVAEREAARDPAWHTAYAAGGVGAFASYGVPDGSAHWVACRLAQSCAPDGWSAPPPAGTDAQLSDAVTAQDSAVEKVRIRIWEAEPAFLPVALSERLVPVRRRLRRFRQRIELCVKILGALEGRGRKVASGALVKAKLALEKADAVHAKEERRIKEKENRDKKAAEIARLKQEKKMEKSMKEKETKVKRAVNRKRGREESAQAMFMKRFVKQKLATQVRAKEVECIAIDGASADACALKPAGEVEDGLRSRAVPVNCDKDVMSASWWLQSEMEAPDFSIMDNALKGLKVHTPGVQVSPEGSFKQHMHSCAKRRTAAETRIHKVLRDYRRQRKIQLDDRMPRFTARRADVRGRGITGPYKLIQFDEDYRPAFFGTNSGRSKTVGPRRPKAKDAELDYSCDSGEEWEEEGDAEDLLDIEVDKERADEDDELRKLYGSDEDDDDDFLDDNDVDDDDEDEDDGDDEAENGIEDANKTEQMTVPVSSVGVSRAIDQASPAEIDLTITTSGGTKRVKSSRDGSADRTKLKRRRRNKFKQSVVILGVSIPKPGEESPLDCYGVSALDDAPRILMFNPYITRVADFLQESSPPKPAPIRIPRTSLDDGAKLDLAVALVTANSRTSRDSIVFEFCERRRSNGLPIPPKIEVVRAMRVIATNEKRKGDTRAGWYLNDQFLAAKIREMNLIPPKPREALPSAVVAAVVEKPPVSGSQVASDVVDASSPTTE